MRKVLLFCALNFLGLLIFSQLSFADSTVYYDKTKFYSEIGENPINSINFEDIPVGTNINNQLISGIKFKSANNVPLEIILAANGVRYPMNSSSGKQVLSPGGSNESLENDDLELLFEKPIQLFGLDVVFDHPDGASYVNIKFFDANNNLIKSTYRHIPSPKGKPGYQFVGLISDIPNISKVYIDDFDPTSPDDHIAYDSFIFSSDIYTLSGCILLRGKGITNTKAVLIQSGEYHQSSILDSKGCFKFNSVNEEIPFSIILRKRTE